MSIFWPADALDEDAGTTPQADPSQVQAGVEAPTSDALHGSWRRVAVQATGLWLATRFALALFTYFAVLFRMGLTGAVSAPLAPADLLASWQKWDANWYLSIAQHGYNQAQATAFFPLYPLFVRAAAVLTGGSWVLA